jgi:hypothetical protein
MNKKELKSVLELAIKEYQEILYEEDKDFLESESGKSFESPEDLSQWVDGLDLCGDYDNATYTIGVINGLESAIRLLDSKPNKLSD